MSIAPEQAAANYAWMVEHGRVPTRPNRPACLQVDRYYRYQLWRAGLRALLQTVLVRRNVPPERRFAYLAFAERVARHRRIYTCLMLERFTAIEVEKAVFRGLDQEVLEEIAVELARLKEEL